MAGVITAAAGLSALQFSGFQRVNVAAPRALRSVNAAPKLCTQFVGCNHSVKVAGGVQLNSRVGGVRAEIHIEEAEVDATIMDIPKTQQAWVYHAYGGKDVLSLDDVSVPDLNPDQVLIKVSAAALNPVDSKRRLGKFQATDSDLPIVPCYDCSGIVVRVGSEVTKFKIGDEVYGDTSEFCLNSPKQYGTLARYAAAEEKLLAIKPKNLSFAEAASLPLALETAYQGWQKGGIKEGQRVLVLGGAGGVGTLAVQLAKHVFKAASVAATTSTGKVNFVKSLGADVVIDYTKQKLEEWPEKYDVVFDTTGKGEGTKVVKPDGGLIVITGPVEPPGFRHLVVSSGSDLEKLNPFFESGSIKPVIDPKGSFPFTEVVEAFEYLETGRATGKVVITPIS